MSTVETEPRRPVTREQRRVLGATLIGTTVEWYDFFIYANAAALMAVEHAPTSRRGLFGAYPQIGVPLGMLLASAVLGVLALALTDDQFEAWGWRVPFLVSFLLIVIGFYIRMRVSESPVFQEIRERAAHARTPVTQLFRKDAPTVIRAALAFVGNNATGYMITGGFILGYATTNLGLAYDTMLMVISAAAAAWIGTTLASGLISDRIGRRPTYLIGYGFLAVWIVPMFLLIETGNVWIILGAVLVLTIGIGLTYGPQSSMYSEMFPARIRFSGVSISYAIGAILGGAFAPTIAQFLVNQTGWVGSVGVYLILASVVSGIAVYTIREPQGADLTPPEEVTGAGAAQDADAGAEADADADPALTRS